MTKAVPNHPIVQLGFSLLLASARDESLRQPERALALARRSVKAVPRNVGAWVSLGWARLRTNAPDAEIVAAFEKAVALHRPPEPEPTAAYEGLALIHARAGRVTEAKAWFAKAVAWLAEHPERARPDTLHREAKAAVAKAASQ